MRTDPGAVGAWRRADMEICVRAFFTRLKGAQAFPTEIVLVLSWFSHDSCTSCPLLWLCTASLSGLEGIVLEGQDACKGLATSASIFRHTLAELDSSLDVLRLREAWAGERPSNGVNTRLLLPYSQQFMRVLFNN